MSLKQITSIRLTALYQNGNDLSTEPVFSGKASKESLHAHALLFPRDWVLRVAKFDVPPLHSATKGSHIWRTQQSAEIDEAQKGCNETQMRGAILRIRASSYVGIPWEQLQTPWKEHIAYSLQKLLDIRILKCSMYQVDRYSITDDHHLSSKFRAIV